MLWLDLNPFFSLSEERDIHNCCSSENRVEFLETEVEKSAQLILRVLDYASDDPENSWDDLEWLGVFF